MRKSTHTPEYRTLRRELRRLRDEAKYSQRDVARRLDAPPSVVANIETGGRRIDLLEYIWYVKACDADPLRAIGDLLELIGDTKPSRAPRGRR